MCWFVYLSFARLEQWLYEEHSASSWAPCEWEAVGGSGGWCVMVKWWWINPPHFLCIPVAATVTILSFSFWERRKALVASTQYIGWTASPQVCCCLLVHSRSQKTGCDGSWETGKTNFLNDTYLVYSLKNSASVCHILQLLKSAYSGSVRGTLTQTYGERSVALKIKWKKITYSFNNKNRNVMYRFSN